MPGGHHPLDAAAYFKRLAELLEANPPAPEDAPMVAKLAKIGVVPGQDFDATKLDPAVANRPQDAVYPTSEGSDIVKKYSGAQEYVMRFDKGQLPPVDGCWSLTMYDAQYFFVDNPLNRYTVSSRSKLKANEDGSIDLYIQSESPGKDEEANWLPAPKGEFVLMLRMYWPKEEPPSILDGSWRVPEVREAC